LSVHEYAHGKVAQMQGDETANDLGRLTLNPIAHIDPVGTILVPLVLLIGSRGRIGFGWARPVPINPFNFRNPRQGVLLVSLAGPVSNIGLALVSGTLLRIVGTEAGQGLFFSLQLILSTLTIINLYLAFFNLIPLPPLDGSGVLSALLPVEYARKYESMGRYGTMLLLVLIVLGGLTGFGIIRLIAGAPAMLLYRLFTGM
jgi:Zn-dependent protease